MIKQIFTLLAIALLLPALAAARLTDLRPYGPLHTRTQNPLTLQMLGLPMEAAQTLNKGQWQTDVSTTFSNVFEYRPSGDTTLTFDMEIWRSVLALQYGITENFDVQAELPFLSTGGGFLDSFVQGYHNAFNFPNGGRERVGNGLYTFQLIDDGVTLFDDSSSPFGFGDLTLRAKWLLPASWHGLPVKIALLPYVKIPTGKVTNGFSSGHVDLGGALLVEKNFKRFHLVTQAGAVLLTGHDKIESILRRAFFQFGQSVEFQIADGLSVIVQFSGNTSAFKNVSAPELKQIALDLNVGLAGEFPLEHALLDEFFYQFSFGEDVTGSGPSVDFSLLFRAGVRY